MTFERTENYALIRQMLTDPRCFRRMVNDAAPAPGDIAVGPIAGIEYILARDEAPAAFFLLQDHGKSAEVHFCCVPQVWGQTVPIVQAFLRWAWRNTSYERLIGPVPAYNRLVLRLAQNAGFGFQAAIPDHVRKYGRTYPLLLLAATRPTP